MNPVADRPLRVCVILGTFLSLLACKMGVLMASIHLALLRMSALPLQSADNNVCVDEPGACHVVGVH